MSLQRKIEVCTLDPGSEKLREKYQPIPSTLILDWYFILSFRKLKKEKKSEDGLSRIRTQIVKHRNIYHKTCYSSSDDCSNPPTSARRKKQKINYKSREQYKPFNTNDRPKLHIILNLELKIRRRLSPFLNINSFRLLIKEGSLATCKNNYTVQNGNGFILSGEAKPLVVD